MKKLFILRIYFRTELIVYKSILSYKVETLYMN